MKRLPRNQIHKRDAEITCMVLNGATQVATGAKYGLGRERVRQIVFRSLFRSSREFVKKHAWGLGMYANKQSVFRKHKRYLIPRLKAAIAPLDE